jgi:hypothetical protein
MTLNGIESVLAIFIETVTTSPACSVDGAAVDDNILRYAGECLILKFPGETLYAL